MITFPSSPSAPLEIEMQTPLIEGIGADPGYVHHGLCKLRFKGFTYERDEETGLSVALPDFEILNWAHWDFKNGICLESGPIKDDEEGAPVVVRHYTSCVEHARNDALESMGNRMARMIA